MTRIVRQINVAPNRRDDAAAHPFSDFFSEPNLVLLGDPGAGKTFTFKQSAVAEGARYLKARAFLNTPDQLLSAQVLFIDGLDEKRAGRGDQDVVDAIVQKLFAVSPAKVRISCRAADWLGESDLAALRPYFEQSGEARVLLLQNLSSAEQRAVLEDQGVDSEGAEEFLARARERGLADFLENPQNLIMLWRAVETGSWPSTRKRLFELSTKLMLEEVNPDRARRGTGAYSVAELRPIAGAICSARLISDVEAISLADQEGTPDIPGYRSVRLFSPEQVQAALSRRVFDACGEPEAVDYAHRTTAEFLAAEFLASRIRSGLPFGRIAALVGIDGYPARELRGLHAWLAVHLPEYADQLIEADPYGVLTYGDAASLSPSSCAHLVRELDRLSKSNPWFRSENWQSLPIGALARRDMVAEFRAVLNNPNSGFGIRSVVVDALSLGTPIPEMLPDLEKIVTRQDAPFAERAGALAALLRLDEAGRAGIRAAYSQLGKALNDLRLRSEIVGELYGEPFGSADVIALLHDSLGAEDSARTATLGILADKIPLSDLPEILDGVNPPKELDEIDPTNALYRTKSARFELRRREAGSFYEFVQPPRSRARAQLAS
jgi:predicted NACHT family NTPase